MRGCIFCSNLFFAYTKQFPQYTGGRMLSSKPKSSKSFWRPKHIWAATFCCLAEASRKTPTTAMLEVLTKAKLGRKIIGFRNKKGAHVYAQSWLEEEYPELVNLKGAFQLFRALSRGTGVRELIKILVGACRYTIPWLKFDCNIFSCCVYVVPCQMKFSVEPEIKGVMIMIV